MDYEAGNAFVIINVIVVVDVLVIVISIAIFIIIIHISFVQLEKKSYTNISMYVHT